MGQYFNFGDNFGALLQEALNRNQKAQQFDEQQAMDYMRLQEAAKQWKQSFDMEKQYKTNDLKLKVLQDMDNRYVSEATAKATLGADHPLFAGRYTGSSTMDASPEDIKTKISTLAMQSSAKNPSGKQLTQEQADDIAQKTIDTANKYGIPVPFFAGMLKQESGFNPYADAYDPSNPKSTRDKSGQGIAQFIPATAADHKIDPFNYADSIDAAGQKLSNSYSKFGDWDLAVAAYFGGDGSIKDGKIPNISDQSSSAQQHVDNVKKQSEFFGTFTSSGTRSANGLTSDQVSAPYSEILGGETPKLPNGVYYEKEAIANATAALRAAKLEAEIGKLTGGKGFDPSAVSRIPLETKSGTTEAYTNIARIPGESTAFRSKAWTDKANSFQTGRDNADREMLLRDEIRKQFPEIPLDKYGRAEYDFDKKEYKLYQAMPATSYTAPDMEKIDEFVASEYPKMLSSLTKMSALDQQRSAPQIAQVGLLLKQMSLVSPKYQRIADPFLAVGSKYLQDVQNDQAKLDSQDRRAEQANAIRLILQAAKSDPKVQEMVNQRAPGLIDLVQ